MSTDTATVEQWRAHGVVLNAPDKVVTTEMLLEFAKAAHINHPDGIVQIAEFALRVTAYPDHHKGAPYLDWRD